MEKRIKMEENAEQDIPLYEKLRMEFLELEKKRVRLYRFLMSNRRLENVSTRHRELLQEQYKAMSKYMRVLDMRMKLLGEELCSGGTGGHGMSETPDGAGSDAKKIYNIIEIELSIDDDE